MVRVGARVWEPRAKTIVGLLLLVAFVLRVTPITWGVPVRPFVGYYHPDEGKIVQGAMDFPADIIQRHDLRYPTCYHYVLGALTLPLRYALRWLAPDMTADTVYLIHHLLARLCTVILGTLNVWLVYLLARRLYDTPTALLSAGLLAVAKMHVMHSSWATVDVPTSFLATLVLYLCCVAIATGTRRSMILLAISAGALVGTKYTGAAILPSVLLAYAVARRPSRSEGRAGLFRFLAGAILMLLLVALSFLVTTPSAAIRPRALLESLRFEMERVAAEGRDLGRASALRQSLDLSMWWDTWGDIGRRVLGVPLAFCALLGMLRSVVTPPKRAALLWVFVLGYLFVVGHEADGRYSIILIPCLCTFAAAFVTWVMRRRPLVGKGLMAAVVVLSLAFTLQALQARLAPDTRTLAAQYMHQHVPFGSSIGVQQVGDNRRDSWKLPPIPRERYAVVEVTSGADYVVLSERDMAKMREALASPHLVDYVWDANERAFWFPGDIPTPETFRLYEDLLLRDGQRYGYRLMATFIPPSSSVYLSFEAPEIRIYQHEVKEARLFACPPTVQHRPLLRFGTSAMLGGVEAPLRVRAGESLSVDLYWKATEVFGLDYVTFVHLLDADYRLHAQSDSIPAAGTRPTRGWMLNEVVRDRHVLQLPPDLPPGTYRLEVGMYAQHSHDRLEVLDKSGRSLGSSTVLGLEIHVLAG